MKLTKNQFIKYVNKFEEMLKQENDILDILKINPEWIPSEWINTYYDFLNDMCELEVDPLCGTTLDWWIFETNFGSKDSVIEPIIIVDGKSIGLDDASALYDYLMGYEVKE